MQPRPTVLLAFMLLVVAGCGVDAAPADGASRTPTMTEPADSPSASPSGQCTPGGTGRGFAISIASDGVRGADSAEAAANSTSYGLPPEYASEPSAWTTVSSMPPYVYLAREGQTLEVSQQTDGSWYVTAGSICD